MRPSHRLVLFLVVVLAAAAAPREVLAMDELTIHSPAFAHEAPIPARYTCQGDDVSPPLQWTGLPEGTEALALIVDDPDAPDPAAPKMT